MKAKVILGTAESEVEAATWITEQVRHLWVTLGIFPKGVQLIKRAVHGSLGELPAHVPDKRDAMGTEEDIAGLSPEEVYSPDESGRIDSRRVAVNLHTNLAIRSELGRCSDTIVRICDRVVNIRELLAIRLDEAVQTFR